MHGAHVTPDQATADLDQQHAMTIDTGCGWSEMNRSDPATVAVSSQRGDGLAEQLLAARVIDREGFAAITEGH